MPEKYPIIIPVLVLPVKLSSWPILIAQPALTQPQIMFIEIPTVLSAGWPLTMLMEDVELWAAVD